jgi:hypothetical protein
MPLTRSSTAALAQQTVSRWIGRTGITDMPNVLLRELTNLYWKGVERDIEDILHALQTWAADKYKAVIPSPPDQESGSDWRGFESFVERATRKPGIAETDPRCSDDVLNCVLSSDATQISFGGRARMAQSLLQAAGFLDIDKLVEYREPPYEFGMWLRPRAAQLTASMQLNTGLPVFGLQLCTNCHEVIRGACFICIGGCPAEPPPPPPAKQNRLVKHRPHTHLTKQRPQTQISALTTVVLCETCVRQTDPPVHPFEHLAKRHKVCVLSDAVTREQAHRICTCWKITDPRNDESRTAEAMYPFRASTRSLHDRSCSLVQLADQHCKAKHAELLRLSQLRNDRPNEEPYGGAGRPSLHRSSTVPTSTGRDIRRRSSFLRQLPSVLSRRFSSASTVLSQPAASNGSIIANGGSSDLQAASGTLGSATDNSVAQISSASGQQVLEPLQRAAIRVAAKTVAPDIPFGNVHMALMVGPLIIENGVPE